jgi:hypothetical protein
MATTPAKAVIGGFASTVTSVPVSQSPVKYRE